MISCLNSNTHFRKLGYLFEHSSYNQYLDGVGLRVDKEEEFVMRGEMILFVFCTASFNFKVLFFLIFQIKATLAVF